MSIEVDDLLHNIFLTLSDDEFAAIAAANGYVRASDLDALKAKLAEVTDQLNDATSTLDQIEAESACFDGLARSAGYVKLEPGQVVVQTKDLTRIVTWFRGDARTVPHADMDTTLNRFAAAIDAAKGEWK